MSCNCLGQQRVTKKCVCILYILYNLAIDIRKDVKKSAHIGVHQVSSVTIEHVRPQQSAWFKQPVQTAQAHFFYLLPGSGIVLTNTAYV